MQLIEHEHPEHGWGYAIKDAGGNIIVQFLNAHTDAKTNELKNSTLQLAREEHQKLINNRGNP